MSILKHKERIDYFDYLVRHGMTGTPKQCAEKLKLSKSSFYRFLEDLRLIDIFVEYNPEKGHYEYQTEGKIVFGFVSDKKLDDNEMSKIKGGCSFLKKNFDESQNMELTHSYLSCSLNNKSIAMRVGTSITSCLIHT